MEANNATTCRQMVPAKITGLRLSGTWLHSLINPREFHQLCHDFVSSSFQVFCFCEECFQLSSSSSSIFIHFLHPRLPPLDLCFFRFHLIQQTEVVGQFGHVPHLILQPWVGPCGSKWMFQTPSGGLLLQEISHMILEQSEAPRPGQSCINEDHGDKVVADIYDGLKKSQRRQTEASQYLSSRRGNKFRDAREQQFLQ